MSDYHNTAISVGTTKEAALYFDYVIPVFLAIEYAPEFLSKAGDFKTARLGDLLPERIYTHPKFTQQIERVNTVSFNIMLKELRKHLGQAPNLKYMTYEEWEAVEDQAATAYNEFISVFGLANIPIVSPNSAVTINDSNSGDIALTLSTLRLIDVSQVTWEQLTEFRNDVNARQKLRRLRLFAAENYDGKSRTYIEDDLNRRIYDYEEESRRWGFETKHAMLTMLLSSKLLGTALSGSLISALFGAPAISVASAIGGSCIELGRIALEVSRRKFILKNALNDNPISYIEDAKIKLAPADS